MADLAGRDHAREVLAGHRRLGGDQSLRLGFADIAGEDATAHRARLTDVTDERARVDACDRGHAAVGQPVEPAALGTRRILAVDRLAHDRRTRPRPLGLHRLGADAVIANVRVGEGDQLAGEAGVGHRLLVAGHAGREDDLAHGVAVGATGVAVEAGAVLE